MPETNFRTLCAELVDIATAHCNPDDSAVGYCAAYRLGVPLDGIATVNIRY